MINKLPLPPKIWYPPSVACVRDGRIPDVRLSGLDLSTCAPAVPPSVTRAPWPTTAPPFSRFTFKVHDPSGRKLRRTRKMQRRYSSLVQQGQLDPARRDSIVQEMERKRQAAFDGLRGLRGAVRPTATSAAKPGPSIKLRPSSLLHSL